MAGFVLAPTEHELQPERIGEIRLRPDASAIWLELPWVPVPAALFTAPSIPGCASGS